MGRAFEKWRDLCERVKEPDDLPTWEDAGPWTRDKLYFWKRYLDIATTPMARKGAFPGGLVYVDLFGGAGVCTLKGSKERFPGSALIAATAERPFRKIILCEKDAKLAEACRARLARTDMGDRCEVLPGDCNELIGEVVKKIPQRALTLAFIDPKGLDAKFSTVELLGNRARADFVVLFADAYDICRNDLMHYWDDPDSKLDQVLGPDSKWRDALEQESFPAGLARRKLFVDIYKTQLQTRLRYSVFREKTMMAGGRPLYRLVFASRHQLGGQFWDEALKEDSSGQRELF
jgi:three-Cys-motif partner protein